MAFSLIPKDEKFFDILEEASENVVKGAKAFRELVSHWSLDSELIPQIREIEHEGDRMTHEVIDRLNRTFITPIDRGDDVVTRSRAIPCTVCRKFSAGS